jgi:hypothetical protein
MLISCSLSRFVHAHVCMHTHMHARARTRARMCTRTPSHLCVCAFAHVRIFAHAQDNEFVFRNNSQGQGEVIDTNSFIDSLTQSVSICLVFFTPRQGLTSVLTINADFSGALSAEVGFEVLHFGILEGGKLYFYIVVQSIVVLNVFLLMLDAVRLAIQIWTDRNTQDGINFGSLVQSITDLVCGLAVLGFIIVRIPQIVQSAGVTSRCTVHGIQMYSHA